MLRQNENGKSLKPAAPVKGKLIYVGLDDTKGFSCYCRQNGSLTVDKIELSGSCAPKLHRTLIPHRLVFFHDSEEKLHDDITAQLIKAVIKTTKIKLTAVHTDPRAILNQEAPTGKFTFTAKTFYVAIDFLVLLTIQADNCEQEITCDGVLNPYCGSTE